MPVSLGEDFDASCYVCTDACILLPYGAVLCSILEMITEGVKLEVGTIRGRPVSDCL